MNRLPYAQQYAINITQSHLNASDNQNLGYAKKDTTNKNLQDVPTPNKNIKATHTTEYINNFVLEPHNTEQNLLNISSQSISPVTTATVTTNTFYTKKPTSILYTKTHTVDKSYKCSYQDCDKEFNRKYTLQQHIRTHTGERPYKCTECSKAFSIKYNLKIHIRIHTGEKPYKCTECSKAFSHRTALQYHIKTHTGERPYKCTECSKAFKIRSNLTSHIRTHTGERPYKCTECIKAFSCKITLQRHVRTHTGDKPYKCTECSKEFSKKNNLQRHVRIHTGDKPFKCISCEKKFSQKSHLKRHIRKLHFLREVVNKKQSLKHSYNQYDNTFKQNECFKDNNLHKDLSLIVAIEPLNVFKDVPKRATKIVVTPEVNATSENKLMIIKTEPLDSEYEQRSFFKKCSYEHKIDNTLPILQYPNNPSKSLLQDKLKWFKKLTYQNFLDLQFYIITKLSIKDYKIAKSQSNIIKILRTCLESFKYNLRSRKTWYTF